MPAMRETGVQSLGQEDPLEKEMATHSSILAWKIHGWRSLVDYSPWGSKELDTTERLHFTSYIKDLADASFVFWGALSYRVRHLATILKRPHGKGESLRLYEGMEKMKRRGGETWPGKGDQKNREAI